MKKLITIILSISMVLSLAACGGKAPAEPDPTPEADAAPTDTPVPATPKPTVEPTASPEPSEEPEPSPDPTPAPEPTPTPAPAPTPAPTPAPEPADTPAPVPEPTPEPEGSAELSLQDIIDKMVEVSAFDGGPFFESYAVSKEDAPYVIGYEGFSSDFVEALAYGPMMGSMAFVMVVFRLDEGADAQAFADDIKANADPAKWICVCADSVQTVVSGNTVLFIMSDTASADLLTAAFSQVMG